MSHSLWEFMALGFKIGMFVVAFACAVLIPIDVVGIVKMLTGGDRRVQEDDDDE